MTRTLAATLILCSCLAGQSSENGQRAATAADSDATHRVMLTEVIPIRTEMTDAILLPQRCDQDGNIYFRKMEDDREFKEDVKKVSPSGEVKSVFKVSTAGQDFKVADFFVSAEGELSQLAWQADQQQKKNVVYVLRYSSDGTFKSKVMLDTAFTPYHLGVFPSGEFFASGTVNLDRKDADSFPMRGPFAAVFRSDGQLAKRIDFEEDKAIVEAIATRDEGLVGSTRYRDAALTSGSILDGGDGNLFLWRRTSPVFLYGISPSGEVRKQFKVAGQSNLFPASILASKGQAAVLLKNYGPEAYMEIIDLSTGEVINSYEVDEKLGGAFSCFTPPSFTFMGEKGNRLALYKAQ